MARLRAMRGNPAALLLNGLLNGLLAGLLAGCAERPLPDAGRFVAQGRAGRVVSTDCFGPGQPDARDSWPGDDATRFRFMPPGCASATGIAQMVVDPADLLRGRPLPPGAALPVARAIERYYNRGPDSQTPLQGSPAGAPSPIPEPGSPDASAPGTGAGATSGAAGSAAPASAAAGDSAAGLLQGPLTTPATGAPAPSP